LDESRGSALDERWTARLGCDWSFVLSRDSVVELRRRHHIGPRRRRGRAQQGAHFFRAQLQLDGVYILFMHDTDAG
jgi:hypothetical protein